jgi:hypothetical protein
MTKKKNNKMTKKNKNKKQNYKLKNLSNLYQGLNILHIEKSIEKQNVILRDVIIDSIKPIRISNLICLETT